MKTLEEHLEELFDAGADWATREADAVQGYEPEEGFTRREEIKTVRAAIVADLRILDSPAKKLALLNYLLVGIVLALSLGVFVLSYQLATC